MEDDQKSIMNVIRAALVVSFSNPGDSLLYVALPLVYRSLGLSIVHVGILLSANRLIRFVSNTFAGYVYGRKTMKRLMIISIITAFVINLSYGFIEGFYLFLFMRIMWGITWSFLRLGGYLAAISYSNEATMGRSMGIFSSISGIGFYLGGLVGGILLDMWGFKSASISLAFGTAIVIPIAFSLVDNKTESVVQDKQPEFNIRTLVGDRDILGIGIGVMLTRLFLGSLIASTLSLYLTESLGSEGITMLGKSIGIASFTGFLLSLRILVKLVLGPLVGELSDKLGRNRTILFLFIFGTISLLLLGLTQSIGVISFAVILSFLSDSGLSVVLTTKVSDIVQTKDVQSHYTLSAFTNWSDLGSSIGPLIIYSLLSEVSFNLLFFGASAFLLIYAIVNQFFLE
jgi:MFS family permease